MATVKSFNVQVSSVSPSSERMEELWVVCAFICRKWITLNYLNKVQNYLNKVQNYLNKVQNYLNKVQNYPIIVSQRRRTTRSLETYPLYSFVFKICVAPVATLWSRMYFLQGTLTLRLLRWLASNFSLQFHPWIRY